MDIKKRFELMKYYVSKNLTICVLILVMMSCQMDHKLPNGFPDKDELAIILADIHYSEALISQVRSKDRNEIANGYYKDVLQKHDLTQEKFDTIIAWYAFYPEIYQKVYEQSLNILSEKEAKWQRVVKEIDDEKKRIQEIKEARNIWSKDKRTLNVVSISSDTLDRRIPFEFNVDTINKKGFRISAFYQFLHGNDLDSVAMCFISLKSDSVVDTVKYYISPSFASKKEEFYIGLKDSVDIKRISGFLFDHDTTIKSRARIKNIEFEFLPLEDSLLVE